jgi:hypothetical protein
MFEPINQFFAPVIAPEQRTTSFCICAAPFPRGLFPGEPSLSNFRTPKQKPINLQVMRIA